MGYHLEYFVALPPAPAREWLAATPGWWAEPESANELPYGEFSWEGEALHPCLGTTVCQVAVPTIKYSWLIRQHGPSVAWVDRFEEWLVRSLPGVRAIRVDEFVRVKWEAHVGRDWEEVPDPIEALESWLISTAQDEDYFRILNEG